MAASDGLSGHDRPGDRRGRAAPWLSAADYAWELLRRNPDYRADFRTRAGDADVDPRWGLRFAVDPDSPAPDADVFWRAEVAPGIVLPLEAGPPEAPLREPLPILGRGRQGVDGRHLRLRNGLQLVLRGEARAEGPLVVVLALDLDYRLRLRAAEALHRPGGSPRTHLSTTRRRRLDRTIQALDGALRGASYRMIARSLFGEQVVEREPWKTASVRDATIRLVRAGETLMRGGYLKLLRGGL